MCSICSAFPLANLSHCAFEPHSACWHRCASIHESSSSSLCQQPRNHPAFVFPSFAFLDTVPTRVAFLWIGSRLRLDSNAQVLHLDSEDKIMACISIGEGFHVSIPHCQHSTCTNAHRSSVASTIFDDASTRPEPFVQHFSICELCSACIDNTISPNDHPAHGGASHLTPSLHFHSCVIFVRYSLG